MSDLKLLALDSEDLEVISAHLQDAIIKVSEMGYAQRDRRFACLMNRFDWTAADGRSKGLRKRAAIHFDRVNSVLASGFDLNAKDGVLELLAITFEPSDPPGGTIQMSFAGGGTLRLQVECLEARLQDLGAAWAARAKPQHAI